MSIFSHVSLTKPKSSTFNLSHNRKMSMNMGTLIPILNMDCVPGDNIRLGTQQMVRLAPLVSPVMHEVNVTNHFFKVPLRILWPEWEDFITGGEDGKDDIVFPRIRNLEVLAGSLGDYLGLPLASSSNKNSLPDVSLLPFIAYMLIWDEYYRDQNLQTSFKEKMKNSPFGWPLKSEIWDYRDPIIKMAFDDIFHLQKRAWQHDYFTSALPFAQKGNPVEIPLGGEVPLSYRNDGTPAVVYNSDGGQTESEGSLGVGPDAGYLVNYHNRNFEANIDVSGQHYVDLSDGTESTTIKDLRNAFSLQRWLERNARAGSRYVEFLLSHFGVRSSDARLQRPEFLGGDKSPIVISEVLQTSETDQSPQANMAGHGLNVGAGFAFKTFIEEHSIIIGVTNIQPTTAYFQGIHKQWFKFDKFDYFFPEFENIGEQEIKNKEIFVAPDGQNDETFGYIPRYSEYKYIPNSVHGDFRDTLDFWHMARKFENRPHLNEEFITADPTTRVFAVEDLPEYGVIYAQYYLNISAKRRMSYYSDPGLFRL